MDKRPIIGLLVNDLEGAYQYGHWIGLDAMAKELGCNLISFNGGDLRSKVTEKRMRNASYKLATPESLDALIIMSTVVANTITMEDTIEFVKSFGSLPVVSAGLEIPGIPTVIVDNVSGMDALVEHVVGFHGRKRPAFLGGFPMNPDAIERHATFLKVLERHGIAVDPRLDLVANFQFELARRLVRQLLDEQIPFDAVIAANDQSALGAMDALMERGVRIPQDVILTGFDDIEDAKFSTPALTSCRQPLIDQGRICLTLAMDLARGKSVPLLSRQPAKLVPRGSCGCHSMSISEGRCESIAPPSNLEMNSPECLLAVKAELLESEDKLLGSPQFAEFYQSLAKEATGIVGGITLLPFERLLQTHSQDEDDDERWQLFLSRLRRACLPFLPNDPQRSTEVDSIFHQLRLLAHERAVQHAAFKSVKTQRWASQLHQTGSRLITTFEVSNLIETLARDLPDLMLISYHILLRDRDSSDDQLRLILSYTQGKRYDLPLEGKVFPSIGIVRDLVEQGTRRGTLAVEPLFFEETQLGFAIIELSPRRGMLLEALRTQVSAALMGARLAVDVRARTTELELALATVEKNQKQLVLSEKMASLGKLTAGIAHEMNTPLSAMRSSLEEIRKLVSEYVESIGDADVGPDDHKAIAADMAKAVDIAIRAGEKASGFVRSIKSQTRDMGAKDKQIFDCVRVVEESILLLSHALRAAKCEARLDVQVKPLSVLGIPDRLAQVVTNLVTNAIDATEASGGGTISVTVEATDGETRITVSDKGTGIAPEHLSRIFDPLFTTKPVGKGTGLGLTIIHDIVQGDFGGRIEVQSVVGQGATFIVRLPEAKEA